MVSGFQAISADDLEDFEPPEYLVDDLLPEQALVMLWAPPDSYKSFVALDWCASVATGRPWLGREVQRAPVLYVAGEGAGGLRKRVKAWKVARKASCPDLHLSTAGTDLHDDENRAGLLAYVLEHGIKLVVMDTLTATFPGLRENDAEDMGTLIAQVAALRDETGATVVIVHHSRKDGSTYRGSSALLGGMDVVLEVKRTGERAVAIHCGKMKDDEQPLPIGAQLAVVEVGQSRKGRLLTSLVVGESSLADTDIVLLSAVRSFVVANPGENRTTIKRKVSGRNDRVLAAVTSLIARGTLVERDGGVYEAVPASGTPGDARF